MSHAKITVIKKALHQDLIDKHVTPEARERGFSVCSVFEEGQEFILTRPDFPEGFCSWAWADIQRDVMMVMFGNGFPWATPKNTAITCCTDGFRPVTFKVEWIEDDA
jgi:uncharacterized repeat protein (TIGR04076 family)